MNPRRAVGPALALALAACGGALPPAGTPEVPAARAPSNVVRADYVGSARCATCHVEIAQAFARSPMHNMTRRPAEARTPFDGRTFVFQGDRATLTAEGPERFVEVESRKYGRHRYRVTKVIGGRHREDFAGIEVDAEGRPVGARVVAGEGEDRAVALRPAEEVILPVSWLLGPQAFRLKGYSVMVKERDGLAAGNVWNRACVYCHNTAPWFATALPAFHGPGAPSAQGTWVDRILPPERRFAYAITDEHAFRAELGREIAFFEGAPAAATPAAGTVPEAVARTIRAATSHLTEDHLVELGIGCESCHGGGRAHVADPSVPPSFAPTSDFLRVAPADGSAASPALLQNRACARCHQVLFSRYPFTWEGGFRAENPGGSNINSGEARDFLLGGCAGAMTCSTCHDPHGGSDRAKLDALATPAGNPVCTTCHGAYAAPEALRRHARHDPAGAGGACVACHLPKKNLGLDTRLTRYHRIGSPTDPARVYGDRPLECALCHVDLSAEALVSAMERGWGKTFDRAKLRALYEDLGRSPLETTVRYGKPHERVPAMMALAERRRPADPLLFLPLVVDELPLIRYFARAALGEATGTPCRLDLDQDTAAIARDVRRCLP